MECGSPAAAFTTEANSTNDRTKMNLQFRLAMTVLSLLILTTTLNSQKDSPMTQHAAGPFDVKITPLEPAFKFEENPLSRMSIDKQFHGDLEASSKGEMLAAGSPATGSGGYVAIERVSGTLHGRSGTFILQHNGTMSHGAYQLNVIVVPDSGTNQLQGLSGKMDIIIKEGKHSYDFAYTLPESK
jgi:Protein of unknown function (DUF3224)